MWPHEAGAWHSEDISASKPNRRSLQRPAFGSAEHSEVDAQIPTSVSTQIKHLVKALNTPDIHKRSAKHCFLLNLGLGPDQSLWSDIHRYSRNQTLLKSWWWSWPDLSAAPRMSVWPNTPGLAADKLGKTARKAVASAKGASETRPGEQGRGSLRGGDPQQTREWSVLRPEAEEPPGNCPEDLPECC